VQNEKLTRKEIIDSRLKQAGWNVADRTQVVEEFFISVENNTVNEPAISYKTKTEFSDYVLLEKNGKPLAVLEAKKSVSDPRIGEEQLHALAQLMNARDPFVTERLLQRVYGNQHAKFLQFIKHILRVEPVRSFEETVTIAFDEFIKLHSTLSNNQIEFMHVLKEYLLDKGKIEKKDLINPPFTQLHPQGILGVFSPKEIEEIISVIQKVAA